MTLWYIIRREIAFRKTGFAIGVASVAVAMAGWVGSVTVLRAHDTQTERILIERERSTREEMVRMEDDYRRIMRDLGYNVMILPPGQNLAELQARGHPDTTMPEMWAERLGQAGIETLNHLLPVLQQRTSWPEHGIEIILSGTPGQIPIVSKPQFLTPDGQAYRSPIQPVIPAGQLILGHTVARELSLAEGDSTTLMGDSFVITRVNAAQGTTDDIAVWCDLAWVQSALGLEGRINLILALECVCEADKIGAVTREVQGLIGDVQVVEFSSRVAARARARERAAEAHRTALEAEREHRARVGAATRRLASILVPAVMTGAAVWMFFLVLNNVRERRAEIGVWRAVGVREGVIMSVFIGKAVVIGLAGAVAGYAVGLGLGAAWGGVLPFSAGFAELVSLRLLIVALVSAPALCAAAGWIPAVMAAQQDPALVLREE